jgi:hypothetical protein
MEIDQLRKIRPGDTLYWRDPDGDACTRTLTVKSLTLADDAGDDSPVTVEEPSGAVVECSPGELYSHVPEWHAVALDVTEHYQIQEDHRPHVTAIWDVYAYDAASATYVCEMTPSRLLIHLYTTAVTTADCPEDMREEIDGLYCQSGDTEPYTYMHVSRVNAYVEAHPDRHVARGAHCATCSHPIEARRSGEGWKHSPARRAFRRRKIVAHVVTPDIETEDEIREHWQGNCPL